MTKIWLNGQFLDEWDALVSVRDRGFRYGDGIFETIPVYNGQLYQFSLHKKRLEDGLTSLGIQANLEKPYHCIASLLKQNNCMDGLLRISITRGTGSQGYLPSVKGEPTIVIETIQPSAPPAAPVTLFISSFHKIPSTCLPTGYKLAQGLNSTLSRMEALEQNCFDAILLTTEGLIAETSSANIFWIKDKRLYTPSLSTGILQGITRQKILALTELPYEEGTFKLPSLLEADEVFLTNVAWGVLSVGSIKGHDTKYSITETKKIHSAYLDDIYHATHTSALA